MASELIVQTLKGPLSGPNANKILIADGHTIEGAGGLIQVVQANKTDTFTATVNTTFVGITGLSVSITPSSTSSKILIMPSLFISPNYNVFYHLRLYRDGVNISDATGDAAGNRARDYSAIYTSVNSTSVGQTMTLPPYLDSPATTSPTTYQIYVGDPYNTGYTFYLNRFARDTDAVYEPRTISTLTAMEIAG